VSAGKREFTTGGAECTGAEQEERRLADHAENVSALDEGEGVFEPIVHERRRKPLRESWFGYVGILMRRRPCADRATRPANV